MDISVRYKDLYQTVMNEHMEVFKSQDTQELADVINIIKEARRIFVMGVGREGIASRAFAMRLMHLGKEVHWIWDDTTPGMGENDLFIATTGSGKIGHIHYVVEEAKKTGAKILVVTGGPNEKTAKLADQVLFVPASVFNGTDSRLVPSVQPMGNLFEQHLFMLFDIIVMLLEEQMEIKHEDMEKRHRNIE